MELVTALLDMRTCNNAHSSFELHLKRFFRIIETNAWKALAVMILRAVFAVCCVARLAVAPYSSLVRTEVSVEHVEILRALHEKNEEALDLYWGGDAASALAVLKSAFSPSEVAPIGMWKTYAYGHV